MNTFVQIVSLRLAAAAGVAAVLVGYPAASAEPIHSATATSQLAANSYAGAIATTHSAILSGGHRQRRIVRSDDLSQVRARNGPPMAPDQAGMEPESVEFIKKDLGVFGSVALPYRAVPMADRWQTILAEGAEMLNNAGCRSSAACESALLGRLSETVTIAAKLPPRARLQLVNSAVNAAITYQSDRRTYGTIDHWATFSELAERGAGDCEDYAILKMWLLKAAGVPSASMQLIVLRDTRRGLYHAVLAVHVSGEAFILDNVEDRIRRDTQLSEYVPIYSLASHGAWIHGFRSRPAAVVEGPLNSVHPGEPASRPVAGGLVDRIRPMAAAFPAAR